MKKTKLLISTDSATIHTGLAETCRLVFRRLLEKYPNHYEIEQLGWFHAEGPEKVPWKIHRTEIRTENGRHSFVPQDKYGQKSFELVRNHFRPDIVWSNGDLWCFEHLLNSVTRNTFRLCVYHTIDGSPYFGTSIEPGVKSDWGNKLNKADEIVTLTEWGSDVLGALPELENKDIKVIYHPSDIERFKVLNSEQKKFIRSKIYPPTIKEDAFVLGWVGRNQFRKMNFKMWEVMHYLKFGDYIVCNDCERVTVKEWDKAKMQSREIGKLMQYDSDYDYSFCSHCKSENIHEGVPKDDTYLWLHTSKNDPGWKTEAMDAIWDVKDRISYTAGLNGAAGLPPDVLAQLISTWDGTLYLTGGEGFGVPAFESIMSGVPVIYTNYSSHADFCKHGGLPVKVTFIPELQLSIDRAIADTNHAIEQCLWAYENRDEFKQLGLNGRKFAETKSIDIIVDQWHELFQDMMTKPIAVEGGTKIFSNII